MSNGLSAPRKKCTIRYKKTLTNLKKYPNYNKERKVLKHGATTKILKLDF